IAVAAIAATLLVGVLAGVIIGIGLSLIWLIFVATHPPMPVLAREPGTQVFRELDEHPGDEQFAGVTVLRLDGGLFFATADALEDRVREVALSAPGSTAIVLDCGGMDFIDSQGSAKMSEILNLTKQAGVTLRLARLKPPVREVLERDGVLGRIGDDKIHGNVDHAVNAQLAVSRGHHADCEQHSSCGPTAPRTRPARTARPASSAVTSAPTRSTPPAPTRSVPRPKPREPATPPPPGRTRAPTHAPPRARRHTRSRIQSATTARRPPCPPRRPRARSCSRPRPPPVPRVPRHPPSARPAHTRSPARTAARTAARPTPAPPGPPPPGQRPLAPSAAGSRKTPGPAARPRPPESPRPRRPTRCSAPPPAGPPPPAPRPPGGASR